MGGRCRLEEVDSYVYLCQEVNMLTISSQRLHVEKLSCGSNFVVILISSKASNQEDRGRLSNATVLKAVTCGIEMWLSPKALVKVGGVGEREIERCMLGVSQ